jgi:hypothetical protein
MQVALSSVWRVRNIISRTFIHKTMRITGDNLLLHDRSLRSLKISDAFKFWNVFKVCFDQAGDSFLCRSDFDVFCFALEQMLLRTVRKDKLAKLDTLCQVDFSKIAKVDK